MHHQAVVVAGGVFATIDDDAAADGIERAYRGQLDGKRRRVDRHGWRRHLARRRPLLLAVLDAHRRHVVAEAHARVEEPPAAPAELPADAGHGVVDDALQAVAVHRTAVLEVEVAPGLLVVLEPFIDTASDQGPYVLVDDAVVALGKAPQAGAAPPAQVDALAPGVDRETVVDDHRVVLHGDRGRLVGERRLVEEQRRVVAGQVDGVVAGAAAHRDLQAGGCRQDVDVVGTAGAVDLELLDAGEVDDAAGAGHEGVGDDEVVAHRGAVDHHRVHARATRDVHRCVLQVGVAVAAAATKQARQVGDRARVVGVAVEHQEGVDDEGVVVFLAEQKQLGHVVVDLEVVVAGTTIEVSHRRHAIAEVVQVDDGHAGWVLEVGVASVRNLRHRADANVVIAAAQIDDGLHGRVVRGHHVVAVEGAHRQAFEVLEHQALATAAVALDRGLELRRHRGVGVALDRRVAVLTAGQGQREDAARVDRSGRQVVGHDLETAGVAAEDHRRARHVRPVLVQLERALQGRRSGHRHRGADVAAGGPDHARAQSHRVRKTGVDQRAREHIAHRARRVQR